MNVSSSYIKIAGPVLVLTVALLPYQNCASNNNSTAAASYSSLSTTDGAWNGQSYQSFGLCPSANGTLPGITTAVTFSSDGTELVIEKQNCSNLAQQITIPAPPKTAFNSGLLMLIGTQIFDQVTVNPAAQAATSTLCTDSNGVLDVTVWTTAAGVTVGQVNLASGPSTGALPLTSTASGFSGPNSFNLVLTNPQSVTFQLQGLTSTDVNLTCYTTGGSGPSGQLLSPVTLLLPGETVYQIPSGVSSLQLALVGAGGGGVAGGAGGGSGGFTDTAVNVPMTTVCLVVGVGGAGANSGNAGNGQASAVFSGNCTSNTQQNQLASSSGGQGANGSSPGTGGTGTANGNAGYNPASQSGSGAPADSSFPFGAGGSQSGSAGQSGFLSILF